MTSARSVFDEWPARYDAWYDDPSGRELFEVEVDCVAPLLGRSRPRLEVGVGTGRFAAALGIEVGLDPALAALGFARRRGVAVVAGVGEHLPFVDGGFAAVLALLTLCYVDDPGALLGEARRVLGPRGRVVLGFVPAESPWGRHFADRGRHGHPFYRGAHLRSVREYRALLERCGLVVVGERSALVDPPGSRIVDRSVRDGVVDGAGFVALAATSP